MKRILLCSAALFGAFTAALAQDTPVAPYLPAFGAPAAPITVQYPQEKMEVLKGAQKVYLFGKLNLPEPKLDINGQSVPVEKNGTFITFLPVEQGSFQFLLTAQSNGKIYQAQRNIIVPGTHIKNFTGKARFDKEEIYPAKPVWVLPGDVITLSARGTPKAEVRVELTGLKGGKRIKMKEDVRIPGLYTAKYVIRENAKPRTVKVIYRMKDPQTKTKAKITAKQRIKILDTQEPLSPARINDPGVKLRQIAIGQGSLYPYYRAFGEVLIDGRDNGLYRLNLGNGAKAWLEEKKLRFFSAQDYQPNFLSEINTLTSAQNTQLLWTNSKQVPVSIQEFNNRMEVTFYYTPQFNENFNFDATSPILERIEWQGPQDGTLKFILYFKNNQTLWGHAYRYEKNNFILELKHQPNITPQPNKPLSGARILLDAGHSPKRKPPYDGLVSPSGYLEYEANIMLAEVLKAKLEKAGATIIMTRQGNNYISLPQRYKKALLEKAHIFISLHHNALPDTTNPLAAPRGYSVYYTYPHSFKLAESVYQAFNRFVPLPDNGLIADDVLYIPRIPEMPSILVENAFMILPEQEALVMSKKGREMFANTIYQGILDFYGVKFAPAAKRRKPQGKKRR